MHSASLSLSPTAFEDVCKCNIKQQCLANTRYKMDDEAVIITRLERELSRAISCLIGNLNLDPI